MITLKINFCSNAQVCYKINKIILLAFQVFAVILFTTMNTSVIECWPYVSYAFHPLAYYFTHEPYYGYGYSNKPNPQGYGFSYGYGLPYYRR